MADGSASSFLVFTDARRGMGVEPGTCRSRFIIFEIREFCTSSSMQQNLSGVVSIVQFLYNIVLLELCSCRIVIMNEDYSSRAIDGADGTIKNKAN